MLSRSPDTRLQAGDEILLAGPTAAVIDAGTDHWSEIEGEHVMRSVPGEVLEVFVSGPRTAWTELWPKSSSGSGMTARGVFLRCLARQGQDVPISPGTRIYVGDVMTLVGLSADLRRATARVGQVLRTGDRIDIAFRRSALRLACWSAC